MIHHILRSGALLLAPLIFVFPAAAQSDLCANPPNPVVAENCLPGTADWITQNPIGDIWGYAATDSVHVGESLDLFVDTASATFDILVYRLGYYGGLGGRLVTSVTAVPGTRQPDCANAHDTGLTTCSRWRVSYTLPIPTDWVSGIYVARIVRPDTGGDNYVLFAVRRDDHDALIRFQQNVSTDQAYNNFGGRSTYSSSSGACLTVAAAPRAVKVSYNRPYNQTMADPNSFFRAAFPILRWLEQNGYDVTYSTTSDTHRAGQPGAKNELLDHAIFLSVGHDEYWSQEMRDAITAARDAGVHLGFFSANTAYWKMRMEADPLTGEPDSVLVTYKTAESGPPDPSGISTSTWRDPAGPDDPETSLLGVMYIGDNDSLYFPLRITSADVAHPIYRHTGLEAMPPDSYINVGDQVVGWEWDAVVDDGRTPENIEILARSPVYGMLLTDAGNSENGALSQAEAHTTRYIAPSGAIVFATGTIHWSWGLGSQAINAADPDPIIAQITYNVLADMGAQPATPADGLILDGSDAAPPPLDPARFLPLDSPAPVISDVQAVVSGDSVTISWKTDIETIGQVWFGGRTGHVIFPMGESLDYTTEHSVTLSDLTTPRNFKVGPAVFTSADRYFRVTATSRAWQSSISDEGRFTVGAAPLSTQLRNTFTSAARPIRCFVVANPTLTGFIVILGALLAGLFIWSLIAWRRRSVKPA